MKAKKVVGDAKRKEMQKKGNWIPDTPTKSSILERLRPRQRKKNNKKHGLVRRTKHCKATVSFEVDGSPKHASVKKANPFGIPNEKNVGTNGALASSSNELIGEAVVPSTPEPTFGRSKQVLNYDSCNHKTDERQFNDDSKHEENSIKEDNCCKIEQNCILSPINGAGCQENSLCMYQRKLRVKQPSCNISKLGPNSPKIGKQKIRGRQKETLLSSLLSSVIATHDRGKDRGENVEEEEADKVLKEEREVLHGCIQNFIKLMRGIQGNRPFSPWKGSVVDSIVGVFLTQNVMDQLSSSAFMSLAARYPNTDMQQENSLDCWDKQKHIVNETKRKKGALRRKMHREQNSSVDTMDSVNWEAVRSAKPKDISAAILTRGMNNNLSKRIQDFLNLLVREHNSIDLEWLRKVPPEKAKEFLMGIYGLGLKSTECVRLLTLKQLAFPVDTNVGRIAVRLGWYPLQTLHEMFPLYLLDKYPKMDDIQKYLWPRLSTLEQGTLYELHYQMITFGKVFCTKRQPNCNACPLSGECKYFQSAKLALPGPWEKSRRTSIFPVTTAENPALITEPIASFLPAVNSCLERDIEDSFYMDRDEIPLMQLKMGKFSENLWNFMDSSTLFPKKDYLSKDLDTLTFEDANISLPKLKKAIGLRTEHIVYELPKGHALPFLAKLERLDLDDPCPYLLAIWPLGESANSVDQPKCDSQELGEQSDGKRFSSPNNSRKHHSQKVLGSFLIPCRTAMRGSFPLNGTYFQVNEVFADDESSQSPIPVPVPLLKGLQRRTLYCGGSTSMIFRGLSAEKIRHCFRRGYICLRGFDCRTRAPRPLPQRFHLQASENGNAERKTKRRSCISPATAATVP